MPKARDVRIVHMPLQSIPPGKGLHAASNHQFTLEPVGTSLDVLLLGHTLLDILSIQVSPVHPNPAACPFSRLPPLKVGFDMPLKVWNASVLLGTAADGALEARSTVNKQGILLALDVARGNVTLVGVGMARRGAAFLRS